MKVLLIKTSSMGDVIHALPAVTEAAQCIPNLQLDWVVEERFAQIPEWHPNVRRVIPMSWRKWRKTPFKSLRSGQCKTFYKQLREEHYDVIIDAQGLFKSAIIGCLAKGERHGYDRRSVREAGVWTLYQKKHAVQKNAHAVKRIRELFAKSLGYTLKESPPVFGLDLAESSLFEHSQEGKVSDDSEKESHSDVPLSYNEPTFDLASSTVKQSNSGKTIICFHGTTWDNKHWPEVYWRALVENLNNAGQSVMLAWGSAAELERAKRLAHNVPNAKVLPDLDVAGVAKVIANADGVVAVDTGFAHLSQAFDKPMVAIFGPTSPGLTGPCGQLQTALSPDFTCAPCQKRTCDFKGETEVFPACMQTITPLQVESQLRAMISLSVCPSRCHPE